ncbi:putative reverse transcriptase domain-containing protein [Tanacetum coccineum]
MAMTIHSGVKGMILAAQREAFDQENVMNERLHGLDQQMERKRDESLYFMDRIWVPLVGGMRTVIMDEAHKSRYSVHPGADKMYYDLRDMYWWPGRGFTATPEIPDGSGKILHGLQSLNTLIKESARLQYGWWLLDIEPNQAHCSGWYMKFISMEKLARLYTDEIVTPQLSPQTDGQVKQTFQSVRRNAEACVIDFSGQLGCPPTSPVLWAEIGEGSLIRPKLVQETNNKVVVIKERLQAVRDHQKSYADNRRKPLEFEVGDRVMLKVSSWKGMVRFRKKGKLAPRYVRPFEILERIGPLAYRLRLPEELSGVHDMFHVSNLKKCLADALHVPLNEIKVDKTLRFIEEPVEILEREIKSLKHSKISLVNVSGVSPTAEVSPRYVWSILEEDPEEYEDDETEDGPVDYPMDGGDDGDDDDGDSSRDDADGEDEDDEEEEEEEEEHLAPADSAIVVPVDEPVFPPEGTEPVERLLAMTTPSPSPPVSLSPPSAGERLIRSMAPPAHSSPPPVPSPLLPSSGFTAALPSPPLPPLPPSLYMPPPADHRGEIPESEQPPRKRLCLSTLGSRYKIGESSTARPTRGRGIDYRFVRTVDAEERRQGIRDVGYGIRDTWVDPAEAVPEIAHMTVGEVNTRVTELAELHEHDTQDLYVLLEDAQDRDSMDGGRGGLCFPRGLGSLNMIESGDSSGASNPS